MQNKIIKMSKIRTYGHREMTAELKHTKAITAALINHILYSKRLLADHVEALEQCIRFMPELEELIELSANKSNPNVREDKPIELFTVRNVCMLLGTTVIEHLITPKGLRITMIPSLLLVSTFSALYAVKNIFLFRNKLVERQLLMLVHTIDKFGNCIRRNMIYFNELLIMKQEELIESMHIERAWDCITAAKEVTEILYDATRQLETEYPLPAKFASYYSPMEELRDCEYFKNNVTNYSPKHIKDFNNIFAYVQSQFLLRLALTIATKPSIHQLSVELEKINSLIQQLVQEEEEHFKNIALDIDKKKEIELENLNATRVMRNLSGPVAVLQDCSLKLSARMVAVAGECHALDTTLQTLNYVEEKNNGQQLVDVASSMRAIENTISVCFEDFQRLVLVYSKFLSSKLETKTDAKPGSAEESQSESFLRVEVCSHDGEGAEKGDDFYAYMFDVEDDEDEDKRKKTDMDRDMEILNFEKRITKGKFRPVLKQLKERLNPIRKEMLDKERRVLTAKGFNVDKLFSKDSDPDDLNWDSDPIESNEEKDSSNGEHLGLIKPIDNRLSQDSDSDSIGSADLEFERQRNKLKKRDNYEEMRKFHAQKEVINILKMDAPPPKNVTGNEEVLESEC